MSVKDEVINGLPQQLAHAREAERSTNQTQPLEASAQMLDLSGSIAQNIRDDLFAGLTLPAADQTLTKRAGSDQYAGLRSLFGMPRDSLTQLIVPAAGSKSWPPT